MQHSAEFGSRPHPPKHYQSARPKPAQPKVHPSKHRTSKNAPRSGSKHKPPPTSPNQNYCSVNLPPQERSLTRNNSQKMVKQRSASRLGMKTDRPRLSPSPLPKDPHHQQGKTSRALTQRTDKEKKSNRSKQQPGLKKSGSRSGLRKEETTDKGHRNRTSVKTEMSSKTHSVIKDEMHRRSVQKRKTRQMGRPEGTTSKLNPKVPRADRKDKVGKKIQRSVLYSEVSFQECNQGGYSGVVAPHRQIEFYGRAKTEGVEWLGSESREHSAAVLIQRVFRGYITRKYINEAMFIIGKVKTIQRWWKKCQRKKQPKPSIESSLVTIKDFNETGNKADWQRLSGSKDSTPGRQHFKELIKNIVEEEWEGQRQSEKAREKKLEMQFALAEDPQGEAPTKSVYIEHKIENEIRSEKLFNSPRHMASSPLARTPKSTHQMREFFSSSSASNDKSKIKERMQSPRVRSPVSHYHSTPSQEPEVQEAPVPRDSIQRFETNHSTIEQFCLLLVNYFREKEEEMRQFVQRINLLYYFRTNLILKNWHCKDLACSEASQDESFSYDHEYLESYERPVLFPEKLRADILAFPEIEIELNNRRYDLDSQPSATIHRTFLQFVFDAFEEAMYQKERDKVVSFGFGRGIKQALDPAETTFQVFFADALSEMLRWGEVLCGLFAELPEQELEAVRQNREGELVNRVEPWDMGEGCRAAIKCQVGFLLEEELWREVVGELLRVVGEVMVL